MKIWYQTVSSERHFPKTLKSYIEDLSAAVGPGVEIEVHGTTNGGLGDQYKIFERLDTDEIIRNLGKIKHGGYDAVAIGNSMDPGVWEFREILDIPVLAHTETAIHFAAMMGRNFSLVCQTDRWRYTYEDIVRRAGLIDKLVSIGNIKCDYISDWDKVWDDQNLCKQAIADFIAESKRHIEAGAEVIVPAAGCVAQLLAQRGVFRIEGVPILDTQTLLIKSTVMAAELHRKWGIWTSRRRAYAQPSADILRKGAELYGIPFA